MSVVCLFVCLLHVVLSEVVITCVAGRRGGLLAKGVVDLEGFV